MRPTVLLGSVLSVLCASLCVQGATWYVDGSLPSSGDGKSWETAFQTIQEGIGAAADGDTVIVGDGTYFENVQFRGKNVVLRSKDPLDPAVVAATIIDADKAGPVVAFSGHETESAVLEGFTLQNGKARNGGGICGGTADKHARAMIRNNMITASSADAGGGGIAWCDGTIEKNTVKGNSAEGEDAKGAGLYECGGTIESNIVTRNSADRGGGLYRCSGTIQNNAISENSGDFGAGLGDCDGTVQYNAIAANNGTGLYECGGTVEQNRIVANEAGLYDCDGTIRHNTIALSSPYGGLVECGGLIERNIIAKNAGSNPGGLYACHGTIQYNTICDNSGRYCGGLGDCDGTIRCNIITGNRRNDPGDACGLEGCRGTIESNMIAGNYGERRGGGGLGSCNGTIRNNIIVGNSTPGAGAALWGCGGIIHNNVIAANSAEESGGGLESCGGTLINCIIWGNTAPVGAQVHEGLTPTYSCIQGWSGSPKRRNIALDPRFVGPVSTGQWSAEPTYDEAAYQTTLVHASASWQPDALAGLTINPDTSQPRQFVIASNSATTITVWGDASQLVAIGDTYEIHDYRLSADSPCIDVGSNDDWMWDGVDMDGHPRIFPGKSSWRADMGAYEYIPPTYPFVACIRSVPAGVQFIWTSHPEETYAISSCVDLLTGNWAEDGAGLASEGLTTRWTHTPPAVGIRFYRVGMK